MTELSRLIVRLQRGMQRQASYIKTIRNPHLLITSLQELNNSIGNDKVKDSVAIQISHLIMVKRRSMDNSRGLSIKEDNVMLNTVLYGPPGTGKTLIGTKLAKIWYSLGYLDGTHNSQNKKQEIGHIIKDMIKDTGVAGSNSNNDTAISIYIMLIFVTIFITLIAMSFSFYNKFGGPCTTAMIATILSTITVVGYYVMNMFNQENGKENCIGPICVGTNNNTTEICDNNSESPSDDQVIHIVSGRDFVGRYVGWTKDKTIELLESCLGKVLFIDEAYTLINGPHDEFGKEALDTLNLFLSTHPREIIVIFAGYADLLEAGPFSVQPGLKRRFMWHVECPGYTGSELFEIYKMQLAKKGWGILDEPGARDVFVKNVDAFPAFGGDTERAGFFAELEHSRDFISNEKGMSINMLELKHVTRGIDKLRDNNFESNGESTNPLANMMKFMAGRNTGRKNNAQSKHKNPIYDDNNDVSDTIVDDVMNQSSKLAFH